MRAGSVAVALLVGGVLIVRGAAAVDVHARAAQAPEPPGSGAPRQEPQEPQPRPAVDETERAASVLRRLLGLHPGPAPGSPSHGPGHPPLEQLPHPRDYVAALLLRYLLPAAPPRETPREEAHEPVQAPAAPQPAGPEVAPARPPVTAGGARPMERPGGGEPAAPPPPRQPAARAGPGPGAAPAEQAAAPRSYAVAGTLTTRYRARWTSSDHDQELQAVLSIRFGDPEHDRVTGALVGRGFADLDGKQTDNVFNGLDESTGHPVDGYLYEAHADWHPDAALDLVRIGRQSLYETPVAVDFDGAYAASVPLGELRATAAAYVGVPVHHFEASRSGDLVAGGVLGCEPWSGGRARLDWMHIADETATLDGQDGLLGLSLWQRLSTVGQLQAQYSWLDGSAYQLFVRGDARIDAVGLDLTASYRQLLHTQRARVTEFDPFFEVIGEYHPYRQLGVTVSEDIGEHAALAAGVDVRRLVDSADAGEFNHEFTRWYVEPSVRDLIDDHLSLSVTLEVFDADTDDQDALGADVEWRFSSELRADLGTAYYLYRFDTITGTERDHVRDYYLRFDWRPSSSWRWNAAVAIEDDDLDLFYTVRLGATWTF